MPRSRHGILCCHIPLRHRKSASVRALLQLATPHDCELFGNRPSAYQPATFASIVMMGTARIAESRTGVSSVTAESRSQNVIRGRARPLQGACYSPLAASKSTGAMAFAAHQRVRVNLAGLMIQGVTFHAAVTDALATIVRKTTDEPPAYLVDLLFSFKGLKEIEVPEERIRPA